MDDDQLAPRPTNRTSLWDIAPATGANWLFALVPHFSSV